MVVSAVVGAFERVNSDVDLWCPFSADHRTQFLTDVQHRGVVSLAFTDGHSTVKGYVVERTAHGLNRCVIGSVFVAFAAPSGAGNGCLVNGFNEVMRQIRGDAHG